MRNKTNELSLELCRRLKEIYNDKNFVVGVLASVEHPDDMREIIRFIDEGKDVSMPSVVSLAYHLYCQRSGDPEYISKKD